MGRRQRLHLIEQISNLRQSFLVCYITGDRENINTRIAPDVIPVIYRHLNLAQKGIPVDLFLYTRGGDVLTPWRLVDLIREYTDYFNVLVPFRAYSAGTLICLGADEIVMTKMGELGPIDPSVTNAFNPLDPSSPAGRIPVNIEDVYSYLTLVKEVAGIKQQEELFKAFRLLAEKIHPLALGNVHRNWTLIRSLAYRLLNLRQNKMPEATVESIVDNLTEKLYAHNHMVSRREARFDLGLPIIFASERLECLMWDLFDDFAQELKLTEPFNPSDLISPSDLKGKHSNFEVPSGIVESLYGQDYFMFNGVVERQDFPDGEKINVNITGHGWKTFKECDG